jgi:type I restriction enzyme S subunit
VKKGWPRKRLGDLLAIQNGFAFDSKLFTTDSGLPLIRIRDLKGGISTEARYSGDFDSRYIVRRGDLLVGMDGDFDCYEWQGEPALLNQRVCRLQSFHASLLPRFLYFGLSKHLKDIEEVTTFATVKHLSSKQILAIEFPLPPLAEQRRIVAILDEAFEGIAKARANAEKNIENARAVFAARTDALFGRADLGWPTCPLGEMAEFRNGINFTKSSRGDRVRIVGVKDFAGNVTVPFDQLAEVVTEGRLADADTIRSNDILFVRSNGSIDLIGRCLLVEELPEPTTHSGFTIRARLKRKDVLPEYLCRVLRANATRQRMISGGIGANIKSLSQGVLAALPIPLPNASKQKHVADELEELERTTEQMAALALRKARALDELKKSLLHHAFAGEL